MNIAALFFMPTLPRPVRWLARALLPAAALAAAARAQSLLPPGRVPLDSFAAFRPVAANWRVAGGLDGDPRREKALTPAAGSGVLVCNPTREARTHLVTTGEHGDLELDLEFLVPPGSNSGVYLQGRYEVQLFDSWGVNAPKYSDCGGIYQRWDATRGKGNEGYEGTAPRANACRAPGLWQRLHVAFRAPRFDAAGKKTAHARFVQVVLNDFTIHENIEVTGPTRSGMFDDEKSLGPIMIQGDHGPIAIRALRLGPLAAATTESSGAPSTKKGKKGAKKKAAAKSESAAVRMKVIPVEPTDRILLQRGFVPYEPKKRLYAASIGTPAGVHFAYDFETGALLRGWHGHFLDTFEMWDGRGANQYAKPTGPALTLNAKPTVALIEFPQSGGWPDEPDALFSSQGYILEPDGQPVFLSTLSGISIRDRIAPAEGGRGLTRTLTFAGTGSDWETDVLLAEASAITPQPGGGYVVGDRDYYIDLPAETAARAEVRTRGDRQLLVVAMPKGAVTAPITYTLVW